MYHLECIKKASGFHGSSRLNVLGTTKSVLFDARAKNLLFRTKIVSHGQTNVFCVI